MTGAPATSALDRVRREVERNIVRARNGIKYVAGTDWTAPEPTPRDAVWRQGKATLWRYRSDQIQFSPPILMFIGLVSRSSIFDLHEKASLVAALRDQGFDVYVLDWGVADASDADNTLETYLCQYLPRALSALLRTSSAKEVSVIGYCMGGAMAVTAIAGQPDLPIRNLVVMAAPFDYEQMPVQFDLLRDPSQDLSPMLDPETGCVPGNVIGSLFSIRKPTADAVQYANLIENLWNDAYVESHQAIARWTSAHVPLPGGVARQVVSHWLRENAFMNGVVRLNGRRADTTTITCPVLSIVTLRDEIVPPAAATPILDLVGSQDRVLLEIDAGHIGLVIGRSARQRTFPQLIDWLRTHSLAQEV